MNRKKVDNDTPLPKKKRKELSDSEKQLVCNELLANLVNKKLPHGLILDISKKYNVDRSTISKFWNKGIKPYVENDSLNELVFNNKKSFRGKKEFMTLLFYKKR